MQASSMQEDGLGPMYGDQGATYLAAQPRTTRPRAHQLGSKAIPCVSRAGHPKVPCPVQSYGFSSEQGQCLSHLCCAAVQRQIDDAADVVTALMEDITEQLFVPTAIADITGVF